MEKVSPIQAYNKLQDALEDYIKFSSSEAQLDNLFFILKNGKDPTSQEFDLKSAIISFP